MSITEVRAAIHAWMNDLDSHVDHTLLEQRFWALTKMDEWLKMGDTHACLRWDGSLNTKGYPVFTIKGVALYAHRVSARIGIKGVVGPHTRINEVAPRAVPDTMTVDHVRARGCIHRDCVYPAHLEVVTQSVNGRRTRNLDVFT